MKRTMQVHRNLVPVVTLSVSLIMLLSIVPLSSQIQNRVVAQNNLSAFKKAVSLPVYQDYGRVADLLEAGQPEQAGTLFDTQSSATLIVTAGGYGDGVMSNYSPTTLLMRLGRVLARQAQNVAETNPEESAVWLARLHGLSSQVLATPEPSLDALTVAHYLDGLATNAETHLLHQTGCRKRACLIASRGKQMESYWKENVYTILQRIAREKTARMNAATALIATATATAETQTAAGLIRDYRSQRSRLGLG